MGSSTSLASMSPFVLFECPYVRDGLESSPEHRQVICPFAHHYHGSFRCIPIPKFVCTKNLYCECNEPVKIMSLVGSTQRQVIYCTNGIHPPLDSNLKRHLEEITTSMAQSFWSGLSNSVTKDQEHEQCRICLEELGFSNPDSFGLLPDCPHQFCAHCLDQWTKAQACQPEGGARCPVCRRGYTGVVRSSRLDLSHEEKMELYQEQNPEPDFWFTGHYEDLPSGSLRTYSPDSLHSSGSRLISQGSLRSRTNSNSSLYSTRVMSPPTSPSTSPFR